MSERTAPPSPSHSPTAARRRGSRAAPRRLSIALAGLLAAAGARGAAAQDPIDPDPTVLRPREGILIDQGILPGRLDLGRLVQELERTWLATPDPAARARAVPTVAAAISCWFRADLAGVARGLVAAEAELRRPEGATVGDLWAGSLMVWPRDRILVPGEELRLSIARAYPLAEEPADGSSELQVEVAGTTARWRTPLPETVSIALPADARGDLPVAIRLVAAGRSRTLPEMVTVAEPWDARIEALRRAIAASRQSVERETARGIDARLFALELRIAPEVPVPAAAELERAERLAASISAGARAPELAAPGDRWLRLPVDAGGTPCRIRVPAEATEGPRPLLLIAHGMGGSEHMFFEAHGDGLAVRLAEERGWIVAAPSFGVAMGGAAIGDIITELEGFLPIDRERIFLLGHSLGAMRIVTAAAREPERYRALAPLSGGGMIPPGTPLGGLPCFLACGDQDFGKGMMQTLEAALRSAGAKVTTKIYAPSEHLLMVVDSLPDVFRFFDATLGGRAVGEE